MVTPGPGAVPVRGSGARGDGRGGPRPERPPGHELPGVAAEEALAEREVAAHQVHHGPRAAPLLSPLESHQLAFPANAAFRAAFTLT